jgi:SAM-dependent methyltransferase
MSFPDVPSPIDFLNADDARAWSDKAMQRPFREDFFAAFASQLQQIDKPALRVLELGAGPGFLAHYLLTRIPALHISLLDYSPAMHQFARERLQAFSSNLTHVERSFKDADWREGLEIYDAVITNQAVHELRHKRHAVTLHRQVLSVLAPDGVYLVADHYCAADAMQNDQLYMTLEEQGQALRAAGFQAEQVLVLGGRALWRATQDQ